MSSSSSNKYVELKIPLKDIVSATNNFSDENLIRRGGFGKVYKGQLQRSGHEPMDVVARRLDPEYRQGKKEFMMEVSMLHALKHGNLVSIIGYCDEKGEKIIINKRETHESLDKYLSDPTTLTWMRRLEICVGVASALRYIHYDEGRDFSVIHRNIKSSKILLDENWKPKLSGFELSMKNTRARRHRLLLDRLSGTIGYIDPRYEKTGAVTHKSDVYSFGVVLFEVLLGRRAFNNPEWFSTQLEKQDSVDDDHPKLMKTTTPSQDEVVKEISTTSFVKLAEGNPPTPTRPRSWVYSGSETLVGAIGILRNESTASVVPPPAPPFVAMTNSFNHSIQIVGRSNLSGAMVPPQLSGHFRNYSPPPSMESPSGGNFSIASRTQSCVSLGGGNRYSSSERIDDPPLSLSETLTGVGRVHSSITSDIMQSLSETSRGVGRVHSSTSNIIMQVPAASSIPVDREEEEEESSYVHPQQRPPLNPLDMCIFTLAPSARFQYEKRLGHLHIPQEHLLAPLAITLYKEKKLYNEIHTDLRENMNQESFDVFSEIAFDCLKDQRSDRPDIDQILIKLRKALDLQWEQEYPALSSEHSHVDAQVEGTLTNRLKEWKKLEHLKISFNDIETATKKFSQNCIGSGGYGKVYKAKLEHFDGKNSLNIEGKNIRDLPKILNTVAIKCLYQRNDTLAEEGFAAEIQTLTSCKHPNIVTLLGFCDEEGSNLILVYEYVANGSLDSYLRNYDKMSNLKWEQRLQMCLEIAQGLNYLHTEHNIIHRDIKSDNILLDDNLVAKIADFGLSKMVPMSLQASYIETNVAGTIVYLDPEYEMTQKLKKASDIYSFGVVLFEIMSGKLAYDKAYMKENIKGLAPIARQHFQNGTQKDMLDSKVKEEFDESIFNSRKGLNQDSLETFLDIAHQCLAETHQNRPEIGTIVVELKKALQFQKNHKDQLQISLEDIKKATNNFSNRIGRGGFGRVYRGEVAPVGGRHTTIAAKKLDTTGGQGETEFLTELEILLEYKHKNVIGLVGYCNEQHEKIIVYEHASKGSLDGHLGNKELTWRTRLEICIDIARGLVFLHGGGVTQEVVMHRDIKSPNILLGDDWNAKISDFGLSSITSIYEDVIDNACGTKGYCDPQYIKDGVFRKASDIYSFGVLLFEILCGRLMFEQQINDQDVKILIETYKSHFKNGKLDDLVFEGIKTQIAPQSLSLFQILANECVDDIPQKRPTTDEVLLRLERALELQDDYDVWKRNLPEDYKEIIQISKSPDIYSNVKYEDLYDKFSKGILLQEGEMLFLLGGNGERNVTISAKSFSYINSCLHKWQYIPELRFQGVAEMLDTLNLGIKINTRTQLLTPNVVYGVYLVFKFCDPRKISSKPLYVNLKYMNGSETSHAYFATWRDNEWMVIELWRFLNTNEVSVFEFLLESFSQSYCEDSTIYVEGIEFRALTDVKYEEIDETKKIQQILESYSNTNLLLQLPTNHEQVFERFKRDDSGEKVFWLPEVNEKKHFMLSAKTTLNNYGDEKLFKTTSSAQSRFQEVVELLPQQVFRISCMIESQMLSRDTNYVCYLVFKISEKCQGLHYPVKVRDLLHWLDKEAQVIYFRSPNPWNLHDTDQAPEQRADGWMEVKVWKFNLNHAFKDDHFYVNLRLHSYEGTMSGLIVGGLEFRPM